MKLLVYTKKGSRIYKNSSKRNYPGHIGFLCDLNDSIHFAISENGTHYHPLKNDTGILFARANVEEDEFGGVTKTLVDPWIFRTKDGGICVAAIRRSGMELDEERKGCITLFFSKDFVHFSEEVFLSVSEVHISSPMIFLRKNRYEILWREESGWYGAISSDLSEIRSINPLQQVRFPRVKQNLRHAKVGNAIDITEKEASALKNAFGEIENANLILAPIRVKAGEDAFEPFENVKATCFYSDGSTHVKGVKLNESDLNKIDFSCKGTYFVRGKVLRETYPFPFISDEIISDPSLKEVGGRYFLTNSSSDRVSVRAADSIAELPLSKRKTLWKFPDTAEYDGASELWAQELHVILGVPYIFTTVAKKGWTSVQAHILRSKGGIENPEDWEEPRLVVKKDGTPLEEEGISLDMTYFEDGGKHYVMWSNRKIYDADLENPVMGTADLFIATIDPNEPWQLTSDPVCILRPEYGWQRCETKVVEGPYAIFHGEDIFVTYSASSTALADLYCLGLLHAKKGADLLKKESWENLPYPVLTKESVKGEYGPGHNTFVRNPETDNDLLVYHAVPHGAFHKAQGRHMALRRIHWKKDGYPYFEMTPERDLNEKFEEVVLKVIVE